MTRLKKKDVVLVVAHHDDEAIFFGSMLLHYRTWMRSLKIVCCTNLRLPQFLLACALLQAVPVTAALQFVKTESISEPKKRYLSGMLRSELTRAQIVITHGLMDCAHYHVHHETVRSLVLEVATTPVLCLDNEGPIVVPPHPDHAKLLECYRDIETKWKWRYMSGEAVRYRWVQ